jgi:hypothetical protein
VPLPAYNKNVWSSEKLFLRLRCHLVTMVQPAESRKGLNLAFTLNPNFCRPTCWRVLREPEMRSVLVIIEQVGTHQPFEMPLIQDNHVVQQVASATSHPTFSNTVLPRTANGRASRLAPISLTAETTSAPNFASRSNSKNLCGSL